MPVTVTKKKKPMAKEIGSEGKSIADVLAAHKKDKGESIGSYGGHPLQVERIATGLLPFDLAIGGGVPRGRCTIIYGPESSCKTNIALRTIAMNQLLRPHETNVYVAIEPFDGPWAAKMGVDVEKLVVVYPSYAEQAVDMVEDFLRADDCGVVVLDSIAAMITTQEASKSAESPTVGGTSMPVGSMVRRTTLALTDAEKAGRSPTLIYINQTRFKVGVMFGDPETMPGGNAPKFQAALWVRVYGKNIMDSSVSANIAVRKEVNFVIKKNKCPIIANSGKFEMAMYPHDGLKIGATADYNTVTEYLKEMGHFEKLKKGYLIVEEEYPTLKAFEDRLYMDAQYGACIRASVMHYVLGKHNDNMIIQEAPTTVDSDGVIEDEAADAED